MNREKQIDMLNEVYDYLVEQNANENILSKLNEVIAQLAIEGLADQLVKGDE